MEPSLSELCPLFYQEYCAVKEQQSGADAKESLLVLSQLTGQSFYEYFSKHHHRPDQDYSSFLSSHSLIAGPPLLYLTLHLCHELLQFLVFYQCSL